MFWEYFLRVLIENNDYQIKKTGTNKYPFINMKLALTPLTLVHFFRNIVYPINQPIFIFHSYAVFIFPFYFAAKHTRVAYLRCPWRSFITSATLPLSKRYLPLILDFDIFLNKKHVL